MYCTGPQKCHDIYTRIRPSSSLKVHLSGNHLSDTHWWSVKNGHPTWYDAQNNIESLPIHHESHIIWWQCSLVDTKVYFLLCVDISKAWGRSRLLTNSSGTTHLQDVDVDVLLYFWLCTMLQLLYLQAREVNLDERLFSQCKLIKMCLSQSRPYEYIFLRKIIMRIHFEGNPFI